MERSWCVKLTLMLIALLILSLFGAEVQAAQGIPEVQIKHISVERLKETVRVNQAKVMKAEIKQMGDFTKYVYEISDGTGRISVMSDRCPPVVGTMALVTGIVVNDPDNATVLMLSEAGRGSADEWTKPPKLYILIGIVFLIILIVVLVVLIFGEKKEINGDPRFQKPLEPYSHVPPTEPQKPLLIDSAGGFSGSYPPAPPLPPSDSRDTTIPVIKPQFGTTGGSVSHQPDDATIPVTPFRPEFRVTSGPDTNKVFSIVGYTTHIGRISRDGGRKNEIEFSDKTVSRDQAKLIFNSSDGNYTLINESTNNPTKVNGRPEQSAVLKDGDDIEFGTTKLLFKIDKK